MAVATSSQKTTDDSSSAANRGSDALSFDRDQVLADYRLATRSRQVSLLGRKEVLTGKAKFGIFGDGKEVAQIAMAKAFAPGDVRSGYYRDQTLMFALDRLSVREFFAQLYAHPDEDFDPASSGRQMNCHFATQMLDEQGRFLNLLEETHSSADVSPTASQMPRLVGLAYASRLYREVPELAAVAEGFSNNGNEIAWGTIGNASCAEGPFWEAINAVGVLRSPLVMGIWDDEYGISVSNEYQIAKGDLSAVLEGFRQEAPDGAGYRIFRVEGWDYPALVETFAEAAQHARANHVPAIVHVVELTQPQGHSTSGSHERYKSKERLAWEQDHCCLVKMREWILAQEFATAEQIDAIDAEEVQAVRSEQQAAWSEFRHPIDEERKIVAASLDELAGALAQSATDEQAQSATDKQKDAVDTIRKRLERKSAPLRRDLVVAAREALFATVGVDASARRALADWVRGEVAVNEERYGSHLLSESDHSPLSIEAVEPETSTDTKRVNGFEVLNACFDQALERMPQLVAFGEDVGYLGDVNQGLSGLQEKYGELRVSDTGIRENTIMGQAIGLAMRGVRPIAEIQYLDYILYGLQILSDDLATLRWRTKGRQMAPVIVRTRGHRLEGVWHTGSPMAAILNLVRGIHVCVPRDMTRAAGLYNTLLAGDDPAIVVEVLNGYRIKEAMPANIGELRVPLGVPELLRQGSDLTVVTYGACCKIALDAAELLAGHGAEIEVIDVQTLLPFDRHGKILESLKKTSRILFLDEDVPGGASAFMMQQVLEVQDGYHHLDSKPLTLAAKAHRPPYGSDGDYFCKPSREDVFEIVWELLREAEPSRFPDLDLPPKI